MAGLQSGWVTPLNLVVCVVNARWGRSSSGVPVASKPFIAARHVKRWGWRVHKRSCVPILQQDPKHVDKLVRAKYRLLCRQGKDTKEAMRMARADYDQDKKDEVSAGASEQVAAMFGLS